MLTAHDWNVFFAAKSTQLGSQDRMDTTWPPCACTLQIRRSAWQPTGSHATEASEKTSLVGSECRHVSPQPTDEHAAPLHTAELFAAALSLDESSAYERSFSVAT